MHVTVIAIGSRGDVQPYVALAVGLRDAGFTVRVATHRQFSGLLEGRGLEQAIVRGDPRDLLVQRRAHTMLDSDTNGLRFLYHFARLLAPAARQIVTDCAEACAGTDAIVQSNTGLLHGFHHLADALDVPECTALLQPFIPTRTFESPFFPEAPAWLGCCRGTYNLSSHRLFLRVFRLIFGRADPIIRQVVGPARRASRDPLGSGPVLCGFSPSVIARPEEWLANVHVTGYWFLDEPPGWEPPEALRTFLDAGPPPVYVGFGSMTSRDPRATTALVFDALERTGQRGILLTGSGAMLAEGLPDSVLPVESAPHDWLFPRTAAVVHHGGAGTTAAGLRAGVPSIVVPHFADQPFWARTVHGLGVGPRPIPRRRLTAARLAETIATALNDEAMRARAAALGERIRAEDGVARAVNIIVEHFDRAPTRE